MWVLNLLILLLPSVFAIEGYKNYSGYQIFQLSPQTDKHLEYIGKLDEGLGFELDVLRAVNKIGHHSEVLIPPEKVKIVAKSLVAENMTYRVAVPDLGAIVARERRALNNANSNSFDPFRYASYEEQARYVDFIAARRSTFMSQGIIGFSNERRPIKFVRIGYPSRNFKPALVIEAGIHAREWIAPATAMYSIHELGNNAAYESLLRAIDIFVIPNSNPDGYEYSRQHDRMWRKTRSGPRGPHRCFGTDGNRNFPHLYGFDGTSTDPCSDIYRGEGPLSEPETAALSRFLLSHKKAIRGFVSVHSYGGNILYPWGHKKRTYPADVNDLIWAGNRMSAAIQRVHGTKYKVDNSADGLYPAAGATDDYAKSIGIKYTYTLELRPTEDEPLSRVGFDLPPQEIKSSAEEAFQGLIELAVIIRNERRAQPSRLLPLVRGKMTGIAHRKPLAPIQNTVSSRPFQTRATKSITPSQLPSKPIKTNVVQNSVKANKPIVAKKPTVAKTTIVSKPFTRGTPPPGVVRTIVRVPKTVVRRAQRQIVAKTQTLSSGKI